MLDFLDTIHKGIMPPFDNLALNAAQQHFNIEGLEGLPLIELIKVKLFITEAKERMKLEWQQIRIRNAHKIVVDHGKYKNPALVNFDKLNGNFGEMYVLPLFLPPGKNEFLIRTAKDLKV